MSNQYFETDGLISAIGHERERTLEKLAGSGRDDFARLQGVAEGLKTAMVVAQAHFEKIFEAEAKS